MSEYKVPTTPEEYLIANNSPEDLLERLKMASDIQNISEIDLIVRVVLSEKFQNDKTNRYDQEVFDELTSLAKSLNQPKVESAEA